MKPILLIVMSSLVAISHSLAGSMLKLPALPETHAVQRVLPNGLTIIVAEDHSSPVVSLQAWCGTGSIHEGKWMGAGLSHILEHMLFQGTKTRASGQIAKQIQDQGGMVNAYTSFDRTVFWIDVPSSGAMEALDILSDAMLHSTLPEEEYAKEQEVIRREFAMGFDDPNRQSMQLMLNTVFGESPFRHPVIGYLDIYNKLTRQDVLDYYHARYVPNNLTFVVAGDVDAEAVINTLEKAFADVPRKAVEPAFVASEPNQLGGRSDDEEFAATELSRLNLAWRVPGLDHPDTPALELLADILGSGRSSLLNQEVREKQHLAHQIGAGMFSLQTDGVFIVQALSDPDKRGAVQKSALEVIQSLKNDGPEPAALARAKRSLLSGQISGLATARGRASDLGSNWLLAKNLNFTRDYLNSAAAVTPADIVRVARKYLTPNTLCATSLNPPGTIAKTAAKEDPRKAREVEKFTLSNGMTLLVREDPRLPLVSMSAVFRGGVLAETKDNNGITKLMAQTLLKGTRTRSARQIAEEIEGVGGSIGSDSGNNSWSVNAEVMSPDLALGIEVLSDVVANPVFDANEVDLEKQARLASIKAEDEQITSAARNLARETFFKDHPYSLRSSGTSASVASLSPADLREFHSRMAVGKNGVISVFGDVKTDEVVRLAEKAFGHLPTGEPAFTNVSSPKPLDGPEIVSREMDKNQAVLMFTFPGPSVTSPDAPAMELINEASNDLGSRFFDRIREQMGLAYFVGSALLAGPVPGCQIFYLGTDPKKVDDVTKAFRDEIASLAANGLTNEELVRAKKKALGKDAIQNQSNSAFAATVALDELLGNGFDDYKSRAERINAVTIEETKAAAAKYLATPGHVEATVAPPA